MVESLVNLCIHKIISTYRLNVQPTCFADYDRKLGIVLNIYKMNIPPELKRLIYEKLRIENITLSLYNLIIGKKWKVYGDIIENYLNDGFRLDILNGLLSMCQLPDKGIGCVIIMRACQYNDIDRIKEIIAHFPCGNTMDLYVLDRELKKLGIIDSYTQNGSFTIMTEMGCFPDRLLDINDCTDNATSLSTLRGYLKHYILNKFDSASRRVILEALEGHVPDSRLVGLIYCLALFITDDKEMREVLIKNHHGKLELFEYNLTDNFNIRKQILDL